MLPHEAPARHLYAVAGTGIGKSLAPSLHFEDDGESWSLRTGDYLAMASTLEWSSSEVRVALARANGDRPVPRTEAFTIEVVGLAGRTLVR
jgi:hypothetical protein